jgi:hypothetical protein
MTCSGPPCVRGLPGVRPASARHPPPSTSSRRRRWVGPALDRPGCAGLALGLGHECDSLGPSLRRALDFCVYKYTSWLKFYSVQSINKKTASISISIKVLLASALSGRGSIALAPPVHENVILFQNQVR